MALYNILVQLKNWAINFSNLCIVGALAAVGYFGYWLYQNGDWQINNSTTHNPL